MGVFLYKYAENYKKKKTCVVFRYFFLIGHHVESNIVEDSRFIDLFSNLL